MNESTGLSLAEIAEAVGGRVRGDGAVTIDGVSAIDSATPKTITWLTSPKFAEHLPACKAGAILVAEDFGATPMPAVLCGQLAEAVGKTLNLFAPRLPQPAVGIHPTAVVDPTAVVHADAAVGPLAVIDARAEIGARTVLHAGVHVGSDARVGADGRLWNGVIVRERCTIGDRVVIHPNAVIGADGFGFYPADGRHHKIAHAGTVVIDDDVEIGAGTMVDRAKTGVTHIGSGTKIDNLVQIGHNSRVGADCLIVAHCATAGSSTLGDRAVLAGYSGIIEHAEVGEGAVCLAQAIAVRNVEPGATVSGNPARDHGRHLREQAAAAKLPALLKQVRDLSDRVQRLEDSADHP